MPVISARTNARSEGYFRREWNLAAQRVLDMAHDTPFLVPVVIDEVREVEARVPDEFLRVHWTRLPNGETPPEFAHRVRQLLSGDTAPARHSQVVQDHRKIAAILAADVVEYSRLMGIDEESTLAGLKLRRALFKRLVAEGGGHEFGSVGDSLMATFPSAVNAVRCAQAIQQQVEQANASLPAGRHMQLRIGINLGDVIEEGGTAFGDAVNAAARLQALAKPGGIMISSSVYEQVRNKLPARFISAGLHQVKNIVEPVRAFVVLPAEVSGVASWRSGLDARLKSRLARRGAAVVAILAAAFLVYGWYQHVTRDLGPQADSRAATLLPARSVAVLPFEDRGGSRGTDVLAEGIPETVMHQLSLLKGLTVIARSSSFAFRDSKDDAREIGRKLNVRYLLEGSVQSAGDRLRVTSTLIDAQSGANVWSRQFDPAPQNVFAVQDEIALEVARAMQVTLASTETPADAARRSGTENYQAYFEFLRGRALLANGRVADVPAALSALNAAITRDPGFASAYVLLARAKIVLAEQAPTDDSIAAFRQAIEDAMGLLNEAIELDPQSGEAYVERGYLKLYFDVVAADTDLRRGIELAPNYARGYEGLAAVLFQSVARRREALEMIEKARRLDPLELRLDVIKATYLQFGPGDYVQAERILRQVLERDPLFVPALVRLADIRRADQRDDAGTLLLAERAVALDPENDPAWREIGVAYLGVGEEAAAEAAFRRTSDHPANGELWLKAHRRKWREAGEKAYTLIEAGPNYAQVEFLVAIAIRRHARETGQYRRAIETLENWAAVTWDGDEPVLEGHLDIGSGVAALADMYMAIGQQERSRVLLEALLADGELQVKRYGRGEGWRNRSKAIALALLGRHDEAMASLERQQQLGISNFEWKIMLFDEPAFEPLRERPAFQKLVQEFRAGEAREREEYLRMRAEGLVPKRS